VAAGARGAPPDERRAAPPDERRGAPPDERRAARAARPARWRPRGRDT